MSDSHLSSDRNWPHWPNFIQFKHQAKELLKSYRSGEACAVAEVERHEQTPDPVTLLRTSLFLKDLGPPLGRSKM